VLPARKHLTVTLASEDLLQSTTCDISESRIHKVSVSKKIAPTSGKNQGAFVTGSLGGGKSTLKAVSLRPVNEPIFSASLQVRRLLTGRITPYDSL